MQETSKPNYIAVEGVIGVGKTSFSGMLAERLSAELLNEEVFENPFLVDFYRNRKRHAFQCQVFFLLSRFQQQQQLMMRDLFAKRINSDVGNRDALLQQLPLLTHEPHRVFRVVQGQFGLLQLFLGLQRLVSSL